MEEACCGLLPAADAVRLLLKLKSFLEMRFVEIVKTLDREKHGWIYVRW